MKFKDPFKKVGTTLAGFLLIYSVSNNEVSAQQTIPMDSIFVEVGKNTEGYKTRSISTPTWELKGGVPQVRDTIDLGKLYLSKNRDDLPRYIFGNGFGVDGSGTKFDAVLVKGEVYSCPEDTCVSCNSGYIWDSGSRNCVVIAGDSCTDTDALNYANAGRIYGVEEDGTASGDPFEYFDSCPLPTTNPEIIIERYCSSGSPFSYQRSCNRVNPTTGVYSGELDTGAVCSGGRCVCPGSEVFLPDGYCGVPAESSCTDSDGDNPMVQGRITWVVNDGSAGGSSGSAVDYCPYSGGDELIEYTCSGTKVVDFPMVDCNFVNEDGDVVSDPTGATCGAGRCVCPTGAEWKDDGRCGLTCGGSDANSSLMIKRSGDVKGKIGNNGKVFLTGSLVQTASSLYGAINIDDLASMSSSGNMYIKGKVYDGLFTDENALKFRDTDNDPLIFTDDGDLKAYLNIYGEFHTVNCVYEHAPSGTIVAS